ncbi:unnamed protein product [Ilex paraguariensis]|uniref:Bet v I/Major latex protein domain-containing protein n=1 Tax=Ilex paraguariensis TaxID=185542 RepID=A0ABC8V2G0_9AQUA
MKLECLRNREPSSSMSTKLKAGNKRKAKHMLSTKLAPRMIELSSSSNHCRRVLRRRRLISSPPPTTHPPLYPTRKTRRQLKSVKHRVAGIDKENLTYSYSIIEGDALMGLESVSYMIEEREIKDGKEKAMGMFKAVEAYLLANPDAYS